MKTRDICAVVLIFACLACAIARAEYATKVHSESRGNKLVVESTGEIEVQSGGILDIQSGATVGFEAGITLDDGVTDSPTLTFTDADNKTFILQKLDSGTATLTNNEGAIGLISSGDADDYLTVSTSTNVPTLGTSGSCDLAITSSSGEITFGDDNVTVLGTVDLGADDDTSTFTLHSAATVVIYDDSDDTSVTIGPVGNGTTILPVTGSLDVSAGVDAGTLSIGSGVISDSSGALSFSDENVTTTGTLTLGADDDTSTLTLHSAGTFVIYDDSDDTSVTIGPVADGTTTLGITGSLSVSGSVAQSLTSGYILVGNGSNVSAAVDPSGDVDLSNTGAFTLTADTVWTVAEFGTWAIDGDGAETNGAGLVCDTPTLTEQAAAYCKTFDFTNTQYVPLATSSSGTDVTNNYQFFSDTKADNDAVYFGGAIPFAEFAIDMSATVQNYTGDALTWEYYNGATWATLTLAYDGTDATAQDGKRSFQQDGAISFIPPTDWAAVEVDSQSAYWIRARISTTANIGANEAQTNSKEHQLVTPADAFEAPQDATVTGVRIVDGTTGTLHTAADVKFILVNFTTGAHSGALTFAQDKRSDTWTGLTLSVTDGDALGVIVTQEDGSDEVINAQLELHVTLK